MVKTNSMQRRELKKEHVIQLVTTLAIIVLLTILSNYLFTRIDLTADKRYTLSSHTKRVLQETDDILYFKVYLDGEMPAGFQRLQNSVREILDEFRAYGEDNIQYEFIDPAASPDKKTRNEVFKQLYEKGLEPTNLQVKEQDGGTTQKIIFPGIIVSYRGNEVPVNILKNYVGFSPEGNLNASIQALEYELTFAIHKLTTLVPPKIGFIEGHGELEPIEVDDIANTLASYYILERVTIDGYLYSLRDTLGKNRYQTIVIAKPEKEFSEKDKFIIDQYLMNGGSILWLIDPVVVNLDSLAYSRSTLALNQSLNLEDMLFKYGVRINYNLIQDMQCAMIPVNTALAGQQAEFSPAPWIYFPLLVPADNHPITRNLDMVKSQFVSVIDTVGSSDKIKKRIILSSSKYSRVVASPALVDLSIISEKMVPERFNKPFLPTGILLEGTFHSVYANRVAPEVSQNSSIGFLAQSKPAKIIVISDGDIIRNQVQRNAGKTEALPLGYDRYTRQTFGNKELMLNCLNYLCDMQGLMEARSKEYKLRLLDKPKILEHRLTWQLINVLLPILLVIASGVIYSFIRKRKYNQ
ncbi:MAG TPA: gliding motility-associated ABC transporter substrate-binding protein GldG [Marinilabiliales bacterium]|jgi:ABC-2 type transport system permease protein|nr:gliding motility-associated ABC transporter substrate-binding protein GldG [Marinilabiliales bacterium]